MTTRKVCLCRKPTITVRFGLVSTAIFVGALNATALERHTCSDDPRETLFYWNGVADPSAGSRLDEPLITDRPDFTEASATVGRGVAQLEAGYTFVHDDDSGTTTELHSYPESLLRVGVLADWLELRVAWNYAEEDDGVIDTEGAEDLYLGVKLGLTSQEGVLPEMALVPQMTVPTGADSRSGDEVLPGLNWLYSWELNEDFELGASTQFNRTIDDESDDPYTEWAQSIAVGVSLTNRLGAYTEWFGLFPDDADSARAEHYFDGGFTVLVNNDVQWDIRAGVGLNDSADDFFAGTGLSLRWK
jgi:hypothetical protein